MSSLHIPAKLLLGTSLLLYSLLAPLSSFASADKVEALISRFEKSSDKVKITNDLFDQLREEGLIDDNTRFKPNTPIDSVRQQFYYWTGEWYCEQQNYQLSKDYGLKALPLYKGASIAKSDCLNLLGVVCVRMGDFASGITYTKQCLDITRKSGNEKLIAATYSTLAGTYIAANDPEAAIKYTLEGLTYADKVEDTTYKGILMGMASEAYNKTGNHAKALEYAEEGYKVDSIGGRKKRMAIRLSQKANALIGLERYAEAAANFRQAIPILKEVGNFHSLAIDYNQLGFALLKMKRNSEAINYFREADRLLDEMGDIYNQLHSKRGLYESYWAVNQDSAYAAMTDFNRLKDSLYSQASADALARYKVEFDTDRLQEEMEHHKSRNIVWISVGVVLLLFIIAVLIFHSWREIQYRKEMQSPEENINDEEMPSITANDKMFLTKVTDAVTEQITNGKVDYALLASTLCLSRAQLNRKIKAITGETTTEYILKIKISLAKHLLDSTDKSIFEIAMDCGMDSDSYFCTLFKKSTGVTPLQYRNRVKQEA